MRGSFLLRALQVTVTHDLLTSLDVETEFFSLCLISTAPLISSMSVRWATWNENEFNRMMVRNKHVKQLTLDTEM